MTKLLVLTKDNKITYCNANGENIGKGRCNHIAHQNKDESIEDFFNIIEDIKISKVSNNSQNNNGIDIERIKNLNENDKIKLIEFENESN